MKQLAALNAFSHQQTNPPSSLLGVVIGIVTNNEDPEGLGRVKVRFPWLSETDESAWARIATPMAGAQRGLYCLPEVDDEVLVAFQHGDMRFPYVLGSLWNGQDAPPATNEDGTNNIRLMKSRSGHEIRLDDTEGAAKIEIVDGSGNNRIVIDTAHNAVTITAAQDITLSAPNGTLTLEAQTLALKAAAATTVEAGSTVDVTASGSMTLKGSTIDLN